MPVGAAPRVVVIGAGISGLAAAHRLVEQSRSQHLAVDVLVVEAGHRAGGSVTSRRQQGFLIEGGPDAFISEKPWALDLCRRLGLVRHLTATNPEHRRSFIVRQGRLLPVPEGFYLLAPARLWPFLTTPVFSWAGKLRMMCELALPCGPAVADESLAAFVLRRFGREALDRMAQPMVSGIYGADPEVLSLRATMPRFLDLERRYRSVTRGLWIETRQRRAAASDRQASGPRYSLFVTLDDGLQVLVNALVDRLPGGSVRYGAPVESVQRVNDGSSARWRVVLRSGEMIDADGVCVALPSYRAATLLRGLDPELAQQLSAVRYTSVAVVNLAYRRVDIRHPLNGFGFVVPSAERRPILGCTFSSVKFPGRAPEGSVLLRAFLGGEMQEDIYAMEDAALLDRVQRELAMLLGIGAPPLWMTLDRHPAAIPQFRVGHLDRVAAIEQQLSSWPGLALVGNGYRGLGIPDCIHGGEQAADRLLQTLWADEHAPSEFGSAA